MNLQSAWLCGKLKASVQSKLPTFSNEFVEFKNSYGQISRDEGKFIENVLLLSKCVLFLADITIVKLRHFQIIPPLRLLKFSSSV